MLMSSCNEILMARSPCGHLTHQRSLAGTLTHLLPMLPLLEMQVWGRDCHVAQHLTSHLFQYASAAYHRCLRCRLGKVIVICNGV